MARKEREDKYSKFNLPMGIMEEMSKDYICNNYSPSALRDKYNVSINTIREMSKEFKWKDRRAKFMDKQVEKATEEMLKKFQLIGEEVSKVFYKQTLNIQRRLKLIPDGEPVPKDLMKEAMLLHDLIQKDLYKLKEIDGKQVPKEITVNSSMPSVLDIQNFKPTITGPPEEKKKEEPAEEPKQVEGPDVKTNAGKSVV